LSGSPGSGVRLRGGPREARLACVFSLRRPSDERVRELIVRAAGRSLSYPHPGVTGGGPLPEGWQIDRYGVELGQGSECFDRALAALMDWRQLQLGWAEACQAQGPPEVGAVVVIRARAFGLWLLAPVRVLYVFDEREAGGGRVAGFAYGTLTGHVEAGEERFVLRQDPHTGNVRYEILAVSRPAHPLVRWGSPLARRAQRRFGRESCAAMVRIVGLNR